MFPAAILILIVLIVLTVQCYRRIHDSTLKRQFKISIGVMLLSLAFCIAFGVLGNKYIDNYEQVDGGCPSSYPYSWAVIATGLIGLAGYFYITVTSFQRKYSKLGFLLIGLAILFVILIALIWLFTVFCLTF